MSFNPRNMTYPACALVYDVNGKKEMPPEFIKRLLREYGEEAKAEFVAARQKLYEENKAAGVREAYWTAHSVVALDYPPLGSADKDLGALSPPTKGQPSFVEGVSIDVGGGQANKSLASLLPQDMLWLHRNIGQPANDDDPAPSAMAAWLWNAARHPANTSKVIDLVAKHLPPPKFIEDKMRMEDGGQDVIDTLDRIMAFE